VRHVEGHSETFHRYAPADTAGRAGNQQDGTTGAQSTVFIPQAQTLVRDMGVTVADEDKDGTGARVSPIRAIKSLKKLADDVEADIPALVRYLMD